MKIRLKNIGIVNDSTIALDGLTIITGKNNSGKTTVGKALYSILDAVSDLTLKAEKDKERYILKRINDVAETMSVLRYFVFSYAKIEDKDHSYISDFPNILSLFSRDYNGYLNQNNNILDYAKKLKEDLIRLNPELLKNDPHAKLYINHITRDGKSSEDFAGYIEKRINTSVKILEELFKALDNDLQLTEYARESINRTLNCEFSGQIQPVSFDADISKIELFNEDTCDFDILISNNQVIKDKNPVFFSSPYKKAFFIDNPFIIDEMLSSKTNLSFMDNDNESLISTSTIVSHNNRLIQALRQSSQPSVLEQTIINESLEKVKSKINSIISGTFEFSVSGDFYVLENGKKLRFSNLATGSKVFSIIKILLEKGLLNKSTMLILDEPEAHLHPAWQNAFAEMIILLAKELNVSIVLTTHSTNFVLALDAYMRKHNIENKTNFYQTIINTETGMVDYKCVNDSINDIYKDFFNYTAEAKALLDKYIKKDGDDI